MESNGQWKMDNNGLAEGKILQHLLQEGLQEVSDSALNDNDLDEHERDITNNEQLQNMMIENYRNHVIKHQKPQPTPLTPQHNKIINGTSNNNYSQRVYHPPVSSSTTVNSASLMSHSQPCLFSVVDKRMDSTNDYSHTQFHTQHSSDPRDENNLLNGPPGLKIVLNPNELALLRNEIGFLKQQNATLQKKCDKLKQLEHAYSRIDQEFEQVLLQREKQEQLEKAAIQKMDGVIQRLSQENDMLQQKNAKLSMFVEQQHQLEDSELQLNLINDILPKNKELVAVQERQKIEIDAQNTTLEEQRTHIEMLEKALTNAQDRLAAKERQAVDAVAVVDKCSHLQKLLQDAVEDKQKRQEEHNKHKAQLEMELAQLRMQISKDNSTFGPRIKSPENEEIIKLKKTINSKEERISQLEDSFLEIQKRYNDELQRNDLHAQRESDALNTKIRSLEQEKAEKERCIQELLDEKGRIHGQWADERRSLDHRVRLLEQDLSHLVVGSNSALSTPHPCIPDVNCSSYSSLRQRSSADFLPTSARAAYLHDATMARMEELKRRIADRRPSPSRKSRLSKEDSRGSKGSSNSSLAIGESHSRASSGPTNYLHQVIDQHLQSDALIGSPLNRNRGGSSSRMMPAYMPENFTQYIESLPAATKRRLTGSEKMAAARRYVRDPSAENSHRVAPPPASMSSLSHSSVVSREPQGLAPGSMRIEVGEMPEYMASQKPPIGVAMDVEQGGTNAKQSARSTTTVVEVNKEHLVLEERSRRSSLGNYRDK